MKNDELETIICNNRQKLERTPKTSVALLINFAYNDFFAELIFFARITCTTFCSLSTMDRGHALTRRKVMKENK